MRFAAAAAVLTFATSAVAVAAPDEPTPAARDEDTASLIAFGTTLGGFGVAMTSVAFDGQTSDALLLAGGGAMIIGPSAGHLYAGEWGHALVTTSLRAASVATIAHFAATDLRFCFGGSCDETPVPISHDLALGAATLTLLGTTIYDLADAHRAARRANDRALAVVPTATSSGGGLAVAGSF